MSEKRLIVDGLIIRYNGIFDVQGLLEHIDKVCSQKGYTKNEKERIERVFSSGKELHMELRPSKKMTDYISLMIKIKMDITNLEELEVTRDKFKMAVNKGLVVMTFDAWTTTDYQGRWEQKPLFYFLRNIFERFFYKFHTDKYVGTVDSDCHYIYYNLKAFLELHKFNSEESALQ